MEKYINVHKDGYVEKADWLFDKYNTDYEIEDAIMEKLAEYEQLDEQGLLLRLPCKVGEKFYLITTLNKIKEARCTGYRYIESLGFCADFEYGDFDSMFVPFSEFSERLFGTQTEAKMALAEMQKAEVQNGE